ncbi:hypothetical protein [Dysgonomonas capnocytophagoides]|uniref:hypothetical protein n=1 Tax=Dysgonomonas capnocytophagoides TaxID=45254 RepID=UPI0030C7E95F
MELSASYTIAGILNTPIKACIQGNQTLYKRVYAERKDTVGYISKYIILNYQKQDYIKKGCASYFNSIHLVCSLFFSFILRLVGLLICAARCRDCTLLLLQKQQQQHKTTIQRYTTSAINSIMITRTKKRDLHKKEPSVSFFHSYFIFFTICILCSSISNAQTKPRPNPVLVKNKSVSTIVSAFFKYTKGGSPNSGKSDQAGIMFFVCFPYASSINKMKSQLAFAAKCRDCTLLLFPIHNKVLILNELLVRKAIKIKPIKLNKSRINKK